MAPTTRRQDSGEPSQTPDAPGNPGTHVDVIVQNQNLPAVDKLKGSENWSDWKYVMETSLGSEDLTYCIYNQPDAATREDPAAMKRDFRAKSHIVFSVGSAALKYVRGSTTAFEAWQRLCAAFEDKGVHRRLALLDQLLDARQTNYSSLENYVYGVKEIVTKIQETGKPIEDGLSAMKLLKGLNAEYKWLRQLIERTRTIPDGSGDTILAFDTVVEELLREAQKEDAEKSNKAAVAVPSSNMGASPRWQPYHRGGRGGFRGGRGGHRGGHSGLRGGRGGSQHTTPTDRQRGQKGTGTGAFPTCKFCKRSNHPERDCWFNPASPQYKLGGQAGASTSTSTSGQQRPAATGPPKWKVAIAKRACDEGDAGH